MIKFIFILLWIPFLFSCSGYKVKGESNPFLEYDITSVSVPVFLNKTILPGVSGPITTQIKKVLHRDTKLIIYSGENEKADAILVGILESAKNRSVVFKTTSEVFTEGELEKSIGGRNKFYLPSTNEYKMQLKLVLIKKPTEPELKLLNSKMSGVMNINPKIIFQKSFNLHGSLSRIVKPTITSDHGGIVNFTTNQEIYRNSIKQMALNVAARFREEILYAF